MIASAHGYATWTPLVLESLREAVSGRRVWDLGCGATVPEAKRLLRLGATHLFLWDKEPVRIPEVAPGLVTVLTGSFQDGLRNGFLEKAMPGDVAFISWPHGSPQALAEVLAHFACVVYVGCTTGGTMCGDLAMWDHLAGRRVLDHVPSRANSLIVYAEPMPGRALLLFEEEAGLDYFRIYCWD